MNVLACVPVNPEQYGLPPYKVGEGFKVTNCNFCNREVWIGPRQQVRRAEQNTPVICLVCCYENDPTSLLRTQHLGGP